VGCADDRASYAGSLLHRSLTVSHHGQAAVCAVAADASVDRRITSDVVQTAYWLLSAQPAVWLGKISYSLYLWQQLFVYGKNKRSCMARVRVPCVSIEGTEGRSNVRHGSLKEQGLEPPMRRGFLRPDDDFVGRAGEPELQTARLIPSYGFSDIERGKLDVPIPGSRAVIIGAGVESATRDGVSGNFLAVAIAKDEQRSEITPLEFGHDCRRVRWRGEERGAFYGRTRRRFVAAHLNVPIALQFNQEGRNRRRRFWSCNRRRSLHHEHRWRGCCWRSCRGQVIPVKRVPQCKGIKNCTAKIVRCMVRGKSGRVSGEMSGPPGRHRTLRDRAWRQGSQQRDRGSHSHSS
jgi:hypothetical protein